MKNNPIVVKSKGEALFRGVAISYIITIAMLLILAFLMFKYDMTERNVNIGIIATYILSNLVLGFSVGKRIRKNSWLWGAVGGLIYFVILIIIGFIVNRQFMGLGESVTNILICCASGMLGGMFS
ncbi:MAG: hypothetical protein K0R15_2232 [Clostridiales bacterium]|nr:hypothetical protein [Clostridiales bacterium]